MQLKKCMSILYSSRSDLKNTCGCTAHLCTQKVTMQSKSGSTKSSIMGLSKVHCLAIIETQSCQSTLRMGRRMCM